MLSFVVGCYDSDVSTPPVFTARYEIWRPLSLVRAHYGLKTARNFARVHWPH